MKIKPSPASIGKSEIRTIQRLNAFIKKNSSYSRNPTKQAKKILLTSKLGTVCHTSFDVFTSKISLQFPSEISQKISKSMKRDTKTDFRPSRPIPITL